MNRISHDGTEYVLMRVWGSFQYTKLSQRGWCFEFLVLALHFIESRLEVWAKLPGAVESNGWINRVKFLRIFKHLTSKPFNMNCKIPIARLLRNHPNFGNYHSRSFDGEGSDLHDFSLAFCSGRATGALAHLEKGQKSDFVLAIQNSSPTSNPANVYNNRCISNQCTKCVRLLCQARTFSFGSKLIHSWWNNCLQFEQQITFPLFEAQHLNTSVFSTSSSCIASPLSSEKVNTIMSITLPFDSASSQDRGDTDLIFPSCTSTRSLLGLLNFTMYGRPFSGIPKMLPFASLFANCTITLSPIENLNVCGSESVSK